GAQTYNDAVTLTGGGTRTFASTGNNALAFNGTVDGGSALVVNTTGTTTFAGAVGGTTALTSLTTNAGGTTSIGGNVTTTGVQTYNDAVTLTGNAVLTGTTPTFASTVAGGGFDLTLNFSGTTTVNGANFTGVRNLATGNGGTTQLTGTITTSGTQTYVDAVTLTGATTLASSGNGAIAFNSTVNGAQTLAVNTTGTTTFAGAVGGTAALTSLTTNAGGTTAINGGSVTTTGAQSYGDNVSLGAPTTLVTTANASITANGSVAANGHLLMLAAGLGDVVMQNAANDLATVSVTSATNVALTDASAIDLGASTIGANLTVSAGGAVTDSGALIVTGVTALTAGSANDITLDNANDFGGNVSIHSGKTVRQNDINSLALDLSNFGTLTATAGGTLTLAGGLTASGTGDAIVLSGSRFVNNAGAGALSAPGGRWLVWSGNPDPFGGVTPDVRGGLAYDFKQYNAIYGTTTVLGAGNGFLYSLVPTITPGLTGAASKVYDGNTTATLTAGNFIASGAVDGDTVVLSATGATYYNKNVGAGKTVTATGITASASNGPTVVYGYTVSPNSASGAIGEITPAALSLNAVSDSKVYDGMTSSGGVVSTVGLVGGDTLSGLSQRFASKNVLGVNGSTLAVNAGYVVSDGNGGANYTVTTNAAPGTIMPASLVIAADDKSRPVGTPNPPFTASYAGFVAGETAAVLDGTLSFLTAATTSSAPGGYSITPFGQTSGNYAIAYVDGTLTVVDTPVRPGSGGETAADQQAIGAQYTSRGMPDDVLSRIRYVFADDKCKDASGTTDVPCAGGSVVRMVNGGILLPRQ
ncbi:MAG TPA: MBG domain-containing protein, partial [Xanthomonadales bacterium]|nr:MBG domain-containing protein [Xanthomonadales bacterium]